MSSTTYNADEETLDFVTLGMFIVDEIHFKPPKPPEVDILGGAGSWSVLGARLFRLPPSSKSIGWIVHRGSDFPDKLSQQIDSWQTDCNLIATPARLTTRGWNSYGDDERRAFKYLTPKLRIDQTQLSEHQIRAKSFHLICTPKRCIDLVKGVLDRRNALDSVLPRPTFVWEPVPDACKPEEFDNALDASRYVDVISPNHQELAAFFGQRARTSNPEQDEQKLGEWCRLILQRGFTKGKGAVVVRCGERGCLWMDGSDLQFRTLPSWHHSDVSDEDIESSSRVVDPTGAGNAFLGGFCVGLLDHEELKWAERLRHAVMSGAVAASFAIEQVGLPTLSYLAGEETWNGDSVARRLEAFRKRDS